MTTNDLPNQPSFTITARTASLEKGILNVPASVDSYFGEHGRIVLVTLPDEQRIHCSIDRKNTTARLSNPLLKEYFSSQNQKGNQYRVKISGTDAISIKLIAPDTKPVESAEESQ